MLYLNVLKLLYRHCLHIVSKYSHHFQSYRQPLKDFKGNLDLQHKSYTVRLVNPHVEGTR